jgi:predicted AlkP superfamily pyrophosphatase or phosphodiesterase
MPDLSEQFLPQILAHRLPELDAGPGAVYPHYGGLALSNLPASVLGWLGAPTGGLQPLASPLLAGLPERFKRVIVLVADGLGYELFRNFLQMEPWAALVERGLFTPLTSITPSTTSAALTTLWTGVPPAGHGIAGYELFLREFGLIANMILHAPASFSGEPGSLRRAGFQPEGFLPVKPLGAQLLKAGVRSYAFQPAGIAGSGLSQMLLRDAEIVPYRTLTDMGVSLRDLLAARAGDRCYIYLYWSDVDTLSHRFGPQDERVQLEIESFSALLARLFERLNLLRSPDTLFVLTADHGLIRTPHEANLELRNHPGLLRLLSMTPSGENRLPFLFVRAGQAEAVAEYVESAWPGRFKLYPRELALRSGMFGPGKQYARLADRVGDWVVVPQGSSYWWFAERENLMQGRHGGFSPDEMLIPLLAVPLGG